MMDIMKFNSNFFKLDMIMDTMKFNSNFSKLGMMMDTMKFNSNFLQAWSDFLQTWHDDIHHGTEQFDSSSVIFRSRTQFMKKYNLLWLFCAESYQ